jgi:hypothetical protein
MKQRIPTTLSALSFAVITATGAKPEPPGTPPEKTPAPAPPNFARQKQPRPMPKAEWLDPDRSAPNGTQYKTFPSKVLGREVSYWGFLYPIDYVHPVLIFPALENTNISVTCASSQCFGCHCQRAGRDGGRIR